MTWLVIGIVIILILAILWPRLPAADKAPADISMLPEIFIVFDFETTGLSADKNEIIEIGAIKVHRDEAEHPSFHALIKPKRKIPKKITELTNITQEMVDAEGVSINEILPQFIDFIGDHHLVAYNISFDLAFLEAAIAKAGINKSINNTTACALQMARRAWPGRKSYKLSEISKDGGLSTSDSHRAIGDCKRTLTIYSAAAGILKSAT